MNPSKSYQVTTKLNNAHILIGYYHYYLFNALLFTEFYLFLIPLLNAQC